ncbi:MAG TPA: hypothetical protein DIU15_19475 [Deltaproteobacteria bacterium]|nr:hypothetical protein [Deltaproteobacteria bacterium]
MTHRLTVLVFFLAMLVGGVTPASGEEAAPEPSPTPGVESDDDIEDSGAPAPADLDPLTAHLQAEVLRYYRGIGAEASAEELDRGLQTLSFMLLDGVSLDRIEAAIHAALQLHSPGRRVPFEVAVPLRVQPAEAGSARSTLAGERQQSSSEGPAPAGEATSEPMPTTNQDALAQKRKQAELKVNRLRLYKQWKSRTRGKRMLISIGIPLLASGYALGFGVAGSLNLFGEIPQSWAWVTSVPLVGTLLLGIWTEGLYPSFFALSVMQIAGAALLVGGIVMRANWPYDKDPTAVHIGTKRGGGPAITLRAGSSGAGGWLIGHF